MAETVLLPKIGITVESCIIGAWNKKAGDTVAIGDVLFSYETDKAVLECESTAGGTLLEVLYNEGDEAPVLSPVCVIGSPGENYQDVLRGGESVGGESFGGSTKSVEGIDGERASSQHKDSGRDARAPSSDTNGADRANGIDARALSKDIGGSESTDGIVGIKISPRARNLAERLGIDYGAAAPSGPNGRVIERDIEQLARVLPASAEAVPALAGVAGAVQAVAAGVAAKVATASLDAKAAAGATNIPAVAVAAKASGTGDGEAGYSDEKLPNIRRVIARTMQKSLSEMAQLTHHHSFDATNVLALRAQFKQFGKQRGMDGVTIGDIILYAVSRILRDFPDFNAHLIDGSVMRRFRDINLGVAIDTERGLMVPTLFNAGEKTLKQISAEVKALAGAARSGSINPDLLGGATFTVSNLGATGIEMFTPIINPPQVAILGVCGVTTRVRAAVANATGAAGSAGAVGSAGAAAIEAYPSMGLSLTYDHRAVDGAPAAVFAQKICEGLENIQMLLISGD
ncbi:MAG: 2-oxo acid dehydrogenase subunit E2 [Oscillospiraceae bacterium]|nr:2-oxo acid dehydrogenase subunit E2 [Oscillospiraceae bacterium]